MGRRRMVSARRGYRAAFLSLVALCVVALGAPPALAIPINSSGPLTTVDVSTDLNCAVNHSGDAAGEFYGDSGLRNALGLPGDDALRSRGDPGGR